jgi:hypothetical protein
MTLPIRQYPKVAGTSGVSYWAIGSVDLDLLPISSTLQLAKLSNTRACQINLECCCSRLREPAKCSRELLKTRFVRKSSHLICKLFLPLGHVIVRISRKYATAEVLCLRHEGFHDTFFFVHH